MGWWQGEARSDGGRVRWGTPTMALHTLVCVCVSVSVNESKEKPKHRVSGMVGYARAPPWDSFARGEGSQM